MKKIGNKEIRRFVKRWKDGGNEDGESHKFWYDIIKVFCNITDVFYLDFEQHVKIKEPGKAKLSDKRIDVYVPSCKILIEQKSGNIDLSKKQATGLTPYEQAKQYYDALPYSKRGRYIITCNFKEIWIYDMDKPFDGPLAIKTEELAEKYDIIQAIFKYDESAVSSLEYANEAAASVKTSEYIAALYDALIDLYDDSESQETAHAINVLIVRIVFLMFAEDCPNLLDRGIFSRLVNDTSAENMNLVLRQLFEVLDTPIDERRNLNSRMKQ